MSTEVKPFKYFDSPDGHDVFKKLLLVLKPTSLIAFGLGTVDVLLYSHPKGYLNTLNRYAYIGLPVLGVSTTFVCTTNALASIRKKDDYLNWFVGGFAAGSIFGVWQRKSIVGFNMGMLLGILAVCRKYGLEIGMKTILPTEDEYAITRGNVWSVNTDWTLTAHRPGNWTTGKD